MCLQAQTCRGQISSAVITLLYKFTENSIIFNIKDVLWNIEIFFISNELLPLRNWNSGDNIRISFKFVRFMSPLRLYELAF